MPFMNYIAAPEQGPTDVGDWEPDQLSTLVMWWKGDIITGSNDDPQDFMIDSSGNGWDGAPNSSLRRGTLKIGGKNGLNTMNILFNGGNYCYYIFGNMYSGKTAGSMYFVTKTTEQPPGTVQNANAFEGFGTTTSYANAGDDGKLGFGTNVQKTVNDIGDFIEVWHIGSFHSGAGIYEYYLNGTLTFNTATNTVSFQAAPEIGRTVIGGGDIRELAEVICTDAVDTEEDRQLIEGYLAKKWFGLGDANPLPEDHPYKGETYVPGPYWEPTDLGSTLLAWYRTDELTGSDGDKIEGADLVDYSGNGNDLSNHTSNARGALLNSGLNGMPVLRLKGTDSPSGLKGYAMPNIFSGKSAGAAFAVLKNDSDPAAGGGGSENMTLWHIGSYVFADVYGWTDGNFYGRFGSTTSRNWNPTPLLNAWRIMSEHSAASDWRAYIDGTATHSTGTNTVGFTSSPKIGFDGGLGSWYGGNIAEMIFCDTVLSTADRQKVEGYLAHKWFGADEFNNLPGDHPYKVLAPEV